MYTTTTPGIAKGNDNTRGGRSKGKRKGDRNVRGNSGENAVKYPYFIVRDFKYC